MPVTDSRICCSSSLITKLMQRSSPMRAVRIEEFGGPEVLQLVETERPEAGDGEVRIRVARAGINLDDTHERQDQYVGVEAVPFVPGSEVVGVREHTGE